MTATSVKNSEQTMTRTIQWKEDNGTYTDARWNEPVLVLWHNTAAAGEYSQITWSASAE